jgi:hypothetical protein
MVRNRLAAINKQYFRPLKNFLPAAGAGVL